jgi:hypothetical protein
MKGFYLRSITRIIIWKAHLIKLMPAFSLGEKFLSVFEVHLISMNIHPPFRKEEEGS